MYGFISTKMNYQKRATHPAFDKTPKLSWVFEPKITEMIYNQLATEAGVRIIDGRLNLKGANMTGT